MDKHIREKIVGALGCVVLFVSLFLPYYDFGEFTRTLYKGCEIKNYIIIAIAVALLFALTEVGIIQIILGVFGVAFFIFGSRAVMPPSELEEYLDIEPEMVSKTLGSYVFLIGALMLILGGLLCIWFHKKYREAYEAQEAEEAKKKAEKETAKDIG